MNFDVPALSEDRGTNKILFCIIVVPWIFVVYIFLKNKLAKEDLKILLKKYDYGNLKVLMIFVISFLIPLYILIIATGGQVWK